MKTRSFAKGFLSITLVLLMLLSLVPTALAATYGADGNITSTSFTLNNFAYGKTVMSASASGEMSIAFVDATKFYESSKATPTSKDDLTETADGWFRADKQYYCAIEFSEHPDLSVGVTNSDDYIYFDRELTATLTCNGISCEKVLDLSENRKVFVYKLPVLEAAPYGIDVTTVIEQGGNVAPTKGTFELEVFNAEVASNFPIDSFTIGGKDISTNGTGNFDSKLTIVNKDYEKLFYLLNEGILVRQKKGTAEGWTYDESVWFVKIHHDPEVNALNKKTETMSGVSFDCFKGKMADGEFVPDSQTPANKVTFTNTYTENTEAVVTKKIPFVKKVTLGGDIEPTGETFKLEIFDIGNSNTDEYADVTYTAEVKVNGKGEFEGELIITGPESQVDQMISEGFYVREIDGKVKNWKYSEAVWHIVPESVEAENNGITVVPTIPGGQNQGLNEPEMVDVLSIYPTTKTVEDGNVRYEDAAETAQKMIFENIYTDSKPVKPSSPDTGDNSMMGLWIALLFVSAFGAVATIVISKKKSVR